MNRILLGKGEQPVYLHAQYGNRHGLVAGATGTGKTVSLMVLAEGFSRLGVPVFMADVKGDVAGLAMPGKRRREDSGSACRAVGVEGYAPEGESGRVLGPLRQVRSSGADDHQRARADAARPDSRTQRRPARRARDRVHAGGRSRTAAARPRRSARAAHLRRRNRKEISAKYGLVSAQSVAAIQRGLLSLEREGGEALFGEPALELTDLLRTDLSGRGIINVLAADQLVLKPRLFSSFLLWLLSELFENLPEVGDLDKPKLVFMFDEAHLLFDDAPPALRERVEQVVRIIRSKGVGVYFCSQFPDDVPGEILGQLGNRVQHALRAFTPRDQKAVRTAAETFVANPRLDVAAGDFDARRRRGARVDAAGRRRADAGGAHDDGAAAQPHRGDHAEERAVVRARSPIGAKYDTPVNRESAYEMLTRCGRCNGCNRCGGCKWCDGCGGARRCDGHEVQSAPAAPSRSTSFSGARSGGRGWSRRWPSRRRGRWGVSSAGRFCAACSGGFSARSARDEADSGLRRLADVGHRSGHAPTASVCAAMAGNAREAARCEAGIQCASSRTA